MADKSITLSQSENSSSAGKKFTAYVTGCDTKYYEGSWAVPDSYTGIGVSIDSTYITVWNTNSTDSDVKATFTWTSSKLSTCQKTLEVTASKADCPGFNVVFVVVFNDDSDGLLESVSGNVQLKFNIIKDSVENPVLGTIGNIAINSTGEFSDEPETIISGCTNTVDNVKFIFDNVDLTCSFSKNIANFTVSGNIEYKLGDSGSYHTMTSVNNYTVSSSSSSATIGNCSLRMTNIWAMMDLSKTLYLKHIINIKYDKYDNVEVTEHKVWIDLQIRFDIDYVHPGICNNTSYTSVDLIVDITCNEDSNIKHTFKYQGLPPQYSGGDSSIEFKTTATSLSGNVEISLAPNGQKMVVLKDSIVIEKGDEGSDNSGTEIFTGDDGYMCNNQVTKYYEYSNMSVSQIWTHSDMSNSRILIDIYIN